MIPPVDANEYETENVGDENREHRNQIRKVSAMRNLHLQNHDGDDDGDDSVTECFQPVFVHGIKVENIFREKRRGASGVGTK